MSDARWLDVMSDAQAAKRHFEHAVELSCDVGFSGSGMDRYRSEMAFMHAMQSAYTSAESGLLRILRLLDEEEPEGDDWHAVLISRLAAPASGNYLRPAVLPAEIAADLHEARRFRHLAARSYEGFDIRRAGPAVEAAGRLSKTLVDALSRFRDTVDPQQPT